MFAEFSSYTMPAARTEFDLLMAHFFYLFYVKHHSVKGFFEVLQFLRQEPETYVVLLRSMTSLPLR